MVVLCDTCAVLMLLRIAPDMFTNPRYECVTIHNVWEELFRTTKFQTKYSWRNQFRSHVKVVYAGALETAAFKATLEVVNVAAQTTLNTRTDRPWGLSRVDCRIAAAVLSRHEDLCTAERDLEDFMQQQFDRENIAPLRLVNNWIEAGLIEWSDSHQTVIEDWIACNERPQPATEIRRFESLTGRRYPS